MPIAKIYNIPPVVIRFILAYLQTDDLERLYGTLNRKIQKALSFPGVLGTLRISSPDTSLRYGQVHFLKAVRNVTRLELPTRLKWSHRLFPLIASLNPLELKLRHDLSNKDIEKALGESPKSGKRPTEAQYWTLLPFPNFELLTPRLQRLELFKCPLAHNDLQKARSSDFRFPYGSQYVFPRSDSKKFVLFPRSLTAFLLHEPSHGELKCFLPSLPKSLRSLTITGKSKSSSKSPSSKLPLNAATFFDYFPHLEHLECERLPDWIPTTTTTSLPNTFSSLALSVSQMSHALEFFLVSNLRKSSTSSITLTVKEKSKINDAIDFTETIPSSLTDLTLAPGPIYSRITSLPPNLTSLTLPVIPQNASLLDRACALLLNLKRLSLLSTTSGGPINLVDVDPKLDTSIQLAPSINLATSILPRALTALSIDQSAKVSAAALSSLPATLFSLTLSSFPLDDFATLRSQCPSCRLTVRTPYCLWRKESRSDFRASPFGVHWGQEVVMEDWAANVLAKCAAEGLTITTCFSEPPTAPSTFVKIFAADALNPSLARFFDFGPDFAKTLVLGLPNLQTLKLNTQLVGSTIAFSDFPPWLTHLEIFDPHLVISPSKPFRSNINLIATDCKLEQVKEAWNLPKSIKYLDAPNWSVDYYTVAKWTLKDLEKLILHVTGILDWQIPLFLPSKIFNAKTRFKMRLKISYGLSGLVVPSSGFHDVTLDAISKYTEEWLQTKLSVAAPRDASLLTAGPPLVLNDFVSERIWDDGLTTSSLFFTKSSRSIAIRSTAPWRLGSAHLDDKNAPFNHFYGLPTEMTSLKKLKRLDVENPLPATPLFQILPSGLKYLRIAYNEMADLGSVLPHSLETLIIEQKLTQNIDHFVLTFRLSALPPSIRHFGVFAHSFALDPLDYRPGEDKELRLPNLKNLCLVGLSLPDALSCRQRFPIGTIKQHLMLVVEPHYVKGEPIPPEALMLPPNEFNRCATLKEAKQGTLDFKQQCDQDFKLENPRL